MRKQATAGDDSCGRSRNWYFSPHQNRIFERFYRVDESTTCSRDGTGLGLAIAKSLIEGMEGRITIRSKPGEGSIFTITLPVWNPQL